MEKDFTLALIVPAVWVANVLFLLIYTIASPVLFFVALFSPYSPQELINSIFGNNNENQ
jgi:hypothetical protein